MIYINTYLKPIDNSGAKLVKCIKVYKKSKKTPGKLCDYMLVSLRKVNPKKKLKVGELCKALIVSSNLKLYRYGGIYIKFSINGIVILNKRDMLLGSRVLKPIAAEIRNIYMARLLLIAPGIF